MTKRHPHDQMDEAALFERMGKVYKLLVDEKKRAGVERPYLLEVAETARRGSATRVLDLACGTGFHARLLARAGCAVTGVDYSASLLKEARSRRTRAHIEYVQGNLLEPVRVRHAADLTLILGNTLSLFPGRGQLGRVLRHAAQATRPGGIVLTQTLNYERLRRLGNVTLTRHGEVDGRETVLTKSLQVVNDGRVRITLTSSQPDESGEWQTVSQGSWLTPVEPRRLVAAARRAGLRVRARYGNLRREAFDAAESPDVVLELERRA